MDVVAGFRQVVSRLRAEGVTVQEVPGWETRGKGALTPKGIINHHTASARAGSTAASLRICTHGRPDLVNAVCNLFVARDGAVYVVAARQAWHAGKGSHPGLKGNADIVGIECDNDGRGEPWTKASLRAQAALNRALMAVFDIPAARILDHKEWAQPPGRKIDRAGIDPAVWRASLLHPAAALEEDDMPDPADLWGHQLGPKGHVAPAGNRLFDAWVWSSQAREAAQETRDLVRRILAELAELSARLDALEKRGGLGQ